jgi:hypothetical protein
MRLQSIWRAAEFVRYRDRNRSVRHRLPLALCISVGQLDSPSTRGFSVRRVIINLLINQSLAALANPHSSLIKAHLGHIQSGFGTGPPESGLMRAAALPYGFSATILPFLQT